MIRIREFIKSGGTLTDAELDAVIQERLETMRSPEQENWLAQVELSMDGYGGEPQRSAIERVLLALKRAATHMKLTHAAPN